MTTNPSEDFHQPENVIGFPNADRTDEQQQYIDPLKAKKYRSTGECNDPRLKGVLQRLHASEGVLSPKRAERLVEALSKGEETVEKAVFLLLDKIKDLEIYLSVSEKSRDEAITLEKGIQSGQKDIDGGINRVLNITRKHGQKLGNKLDRKQNDDHHKSQELVEEITYFQRFLMEEAHISVVAFEQSPHPQAYFRRIKDYLSYLPGCCRLLVNLTRQSIFDKVPGIQSDDLTL